MSKKLAIAMFGQKRLSREGGVEIVVKELCTRMAQNGCDVTCYNRAGHHVSGAEYDDAGKTEYEGIRQKSVPTIERRGLAAVSSSAFAALYSAFGKYDVVHIHAEGPAFFAWLPKMFGKRVVVTVHGIDWQREKWQSGLGSKFIHQGEKNAAKYADEVIVLSKGVQDYFKVTYGRKTHFIPNGVNRPQIREASLITDKFGLKKDSYILFLGRLVPEKGIRYLVEAFKNVKTDKKLVIAGGSSDTDSFMEELKELAKGDDRILFTGFVQGAMLDELYSNAYIYTLPSDLEGMPFYGRGAGWQRQNHIYLTPFYYIDYCLAQTVALQFWLEIEKDWEQAWEKYKMFVQRGGTDTFLGLVAGVGLASPVEDGCIREIAGHASEWLKEHKL